MAEAMNWDEIESSPIGRFETQPHYDHDSDSLSVFVNDDESYRQRIDKMLSVYRSIKTNEVVGIQIKHVQKIMETVDAFNVGVTSGNVTIGLLLMGLELSTADEPKIRSHEYREFIRPIAACVGSRLIPEFAMA